MKSESQLYNFFYIGRQKWFDDFARYFFFVVGLIFEETNKKLTCSYFMGSKYSSDVYEL